MYLCFMLYLATVKLLRVKILGWVIKAYFSTGNSIVWN